MSRSPSSSPVRKRARLSSPTYDDQVGELTQAELDAFGAIDAQLSQSIRPPTSTFQRASALENNEGWDSSQLQSTQTSARAGFAFVKASGLEDDPDNPFSAGFTSAAAVKAPVPKPAGFTTAGFASASKLPLVQDHERSPSPDAPPEEPDYDAWFKPAAGADMTPAFQAPLFSTGAALMGFTKASNKGVIKPSEKALALAKAKEDAWNREEEERIQNEDGNAKALEPPESIRLPGFTSASTSATGFQLASSRHLLAESPRPVLGPVPSHIFNTPSTPSPAGFNRPSFTRPTPSQPQATPANSMYRPKQFKPPMLRPPGTPSSIAQSPLNPRRGNMSGFAPASSQGASQLPSTQHQHPLAAPPLTSRSGFTTPARNRGFAAPISTSTPAFNTPLRINPTAPVNHITNSQRRNTPAPFKTPFKPGMAPSEAGRLALSRPAPPLAAVAAGGRRPVPVVATPIRPAGNGNIFTTERAPRAKPVKRTFFNTAREGPRQTLAESGVRPQQYEPSELEEMGIPISMLSQITPETAMYYSFNVNPSSSSTASSSSSTPQSSTLGPAEALKELLAKGCTLATKPWVDNHWALILWKLAGMSALEAEKRAERWCWDEVMRQLLYRYERELNSGARPPLRKVVNQDTPAACPLVLCVSNIVWSPPGVTEDGLPIEPHPELEVTDGWYRLRAQVDLPLARAVRRGIVRIGRKLGVAGARLETEKKEPMEILEAYNSNKLVISSNSAQLMPWHTKLGWMQGPCISTLHSLSSDGGLVTAMDLVITKLYPVAYIEFIEEEDGTKGRIGPRNEAEEMQVNEKWKRKYQLEASKLRETHEKKIGRYEAYVDRLERKASSSGPFQPKEDEYPPDHIDTYYDELEYPDSAARCLARISARDAGWLALHIRKESERARERVAEDVEKEMMSICPPRNVRSFRVLFVEDARTNKRPKNRVAQLTVWDAAGFSLGENSNSGAAFAVGQRFLVTNLIPQQLSAWMDCEAGSEVFLSTRKDSRWTRIRGSV